MTPDDILKIANLGAIPMLTFAMVVLWRDLQATKREFVDYLKESADKGDTAAQTAIQKRTR